MKFQEILNALEKNPELKFTHKKSAVWLSRKDLISLSAEMIIDSNWELQDQVIRLNKPRLVFVNPKDSL